MASTSSCSAAASRHLIDANNKVAAVESFRNKSQCMMVYLPSLPSPAKTTAYCGNIARNVVAMATGEAPAAANANELVVPEIVKTIQQTVKVYSIFFFLFYLYFLTSVYAHFPFSPVCTLFK